MSLAINKVNAFEGLARFARKCQMDFGFIRLKSNKFESIPFCFVEPPPKWIRFKFCMLFFYLMMSELKLRQLFFHLKYSNPF